MSDFVRPRRWQPTRLPRPWDSPGKNTGVGCHFLLQCMKVKMKSLSRVQLLAATWTAAYQAPPSMGFSRQEYWSGVPLPSPMTEVSTVIRGGQRARYLFFFFFFSFAVWWHSKKTTICKPSRGLFSRTNCTDAMILNFQPPEFWETNVY